ncbi:hypothetical protein, partial [Streptococcus pneumoniae]|uniref:hypothetical protein n=1 Tax=Streptococcus pneumoniae TaxID=1313 RepID=UPI0013DB8DE2
NLIVPLNQSLALQSPSAGREFFGNWPIDNFVDDLNVSRDPINHCQSVTPLQIRRIDDNALTLAKPSENAPPDLLEDLRLI